MTKAIAQAVGKDRRRSRKPRRRPIPKWLKTGNDLDAIAKSRALMLLSVLSGETPVTTAITQARISRNTYYHLETRALNAMLAALNPLAGASADGRADLTAATHRIAELEQKIRALEQDKRRVERLLWLTRKTFKAPVASNRRGPWPGRRRATSAGTALPMSQAANSPAASSAH